VKIPGALFPELPEIEAATMAWANAAGLTVPSFRVLRSDAVEGVSPRIMDASPTVFAIERFDRKVDGRIHQEDLAQVFEVPPACKYGDAGALRRHGKIRYSGVARMIEDLCGEKGRYEFLERLAFVVASGNGDAHLKNWSLQWSHEHRPWLSPCYDLVATVSWPDQDKSLALELIPGVSRFSSVDRATLRTFVAATGAKEAEDHFLAALQRAKATWKMISDRAPLRMRAALVEHWQQVPVLRELGGLVG
jgi:serine/threonine-protein kinase HipA